MSNRKQPANPKNAVVPRLPEDVIDAAILWGVKLDYNIATPGMQQAFQAWLNTDPTHVLAWQRISSFRSSFSQLPPALARDTLHTAQQKHGDREAQRRRTLKVLSLSGIAMAMAWTADRAMPWQRLLSSASTSVGEQRTVHLADGTTILLNTDSAIRIDLSGTRRRIVLSRGEIMIATGNDAQAASKRAFWVYTPFGRMEALGTRFAVRLGAEGTRVSVQEGAVELHAADEAHTYVVRPGESRMLRDDAISPAQQHHFSDDGFADGVIAGDNIPLAELLGELSRYRHGRINCDARVAGIKVSGLFHVADTDRTLQFLEQILPVEVTYRTRFWVTVGPQPPQT